MILQDGDVDHYRYPKTDERDRDERLIRALGVLFGRSSEEIENAVEWIRMVREEPAERGKVGG